MKNTHALPAIPKEEPKQLTDLEIAIKLEEIEKEEPKQERMYSEEDMRNAFDSAREFNSLDGVVDVHIVLPMGGDMSDLQPLHFTFDEWLEQFKKK
jgi:hypothetical protein